MAKIQIKSIYGSVKFEGNFSGIKEAVIVFLKTPGADLYGADLRGADLYGADLRGADLRDADLRGANLRDADLRGADLRGVDLYGADLCGADLRGADLRDAGLYGAGLYGADLRGVDLCGADLRGADLRDAKNSETAIAQTRILPEGDIIGWKKCRDQVIVKLRIPANAKRSHAFGRKCRAEFAEVLQISTGTIARSKYNVDFTYEVGKVVKPENEFCEDFQQECADGIHFFITELEAKNYDE